MIKRLLRGATYPLLALGYMSRHRLWRLAAVPVVINTALLTALIAGTVMLFAPWVGQLQDWLASAAGDSSVLAALTKALGLVVWVLAVTAAVVVNGLLLVLAGRAVAGPFLDLLSERVEALQLGVEAGGFSVSRAIVSVGIAVADLLWGLLFWVAVNVPLLVIGLIPAVGSFSAAAVSVCFTALLVAHEFIGLSLTRRLVGYRQRWGVIMANKAISLGFGLVTVALLAVPGLNLVLLPLCTVGGTLLYCDLRASGRLASIGR